LFLVETKPPKEAAGGAWSGGRRGRKRRSRRRRSRRRSRRRRSRRRSRRRRRRRRVRGEALFHPLFPENNASETKSLFERSSASDSRRSPRQGK